MKWGIPMLAFAGLMVVPAVAWAGVCPNGCASPCACVSDCAEPAPVCVKQRIECCHEKTTYRLVRVTEPVTRQRLVCYRDPCDPCRVKSKIVHEVHNRVRYRWVCETRPACHTRTVKVCQRPEETRVVAPPVAAEAVPQVSAPRTSDVRVGAS